MKITNWEDYDSLEEELATKEARSKTNSKKKKKGYAMGGAMKKKGFAKGGMAKKGYAMGGKMKKGYAKGGAAKMKRGGAAKKK